jgi:septal ring factor EnvC (AmiA/AmiB activator)
MRVLDPSPTAGFEAERGKLGSPVTGDVRIAEGRRAESDGPGLEFQAPVGTPVRAVSAGRVAFSDRYGSYGRLVILDHGDGYYTVYGGLGAVEVRVGDDLSRQARIGSIGTDFSPSALFFEVRKGTRAMEPRSWLGL